MDIKLEPSSLDEITRNTINEKYQIKQDKNEIEIYIKFKCPFMNCQKNFKSKKAMKDHIRIHNGEKPYSWYIIYKDLNI